MELEQSRRIDSTAEESEASPRWKDGSGTDETGRRSNPTHVYIGASAEKTLCRGVEAGSFSRTRKYENDVHDSRRNKEMFV